VIGTGLHAGRLPASSPGFTAIEPAGVVVSEVKKAETGDDLVIRLYETEGTKGTASVELNAAVFGQVESVREADLLERPLEKGTARMKANGFTVDMPAYGIATVRVRMKATGG
jgi:alpha-mannosidase